MAKPSDFKGIFPLLTVAEIRHTYDELTGRTDDYLAKKYGFKSHFSLYNAIRVLETGCPELIAAMDQQTLQGEDFSIHLAAKVAGLSKELQRDLLSKGLKEIRRYFKPTQKQETKTFNPSLKSNPREVKEGQNDMRELSISERVQLARKEWGQIDERRGRKKQKKEADKALIRHTYDELTGRTDDYLAKKYGFNSRFSLYDALAAVKTGCRKLIATMDQQTLQGSVFTVHLAAKVASLPNALQRQLLSKGPKGIEHYFNKTEGK